MVAPSVLRTGSGAGTRARDPSQYGQHDSAQIGVAPTITYRRPLPKQRQPCQSRGERWVAWQNLTRQQVVQGFGGCSYHILDYSMPLSAPELNAWRGRALPIGKDVLEEGGRESGTQKFVYQKWPDKLCLCSSPLPIDLWQHTTHTKLLHPRTDSTPSLTMHQHALLSENSNT